MIIWPDLFFLYRRKQEKTPILIWHLFILVAYVDEYSDRTKQDLSFATRCLVLLVPVVLQFLGRYASVSNL